MIPLTRAQREQQAKILERVSDHVRHRLSYGAEAVEALEAGAAALRGDPGEGWHDISTFQWPERLSDDKQALYCTNRGRVIAAFAHSNGWVYGDLRLSTKESEFSSSYPARRDAKWSEGAPCPSGIERVILWQALPSPPSVTGSEQK